MENYTKDDDNKNGDDGSITILNMVLMVPSSTSATLTGSKQSESANRTALYSWKWYDRHRACSHLF